MEGLGKGLSKLSVPQVQRLFSRNWLGVIKLQKGHWRGVTNRLKGGGR